MTCRNGELHPQWEEELIINQEAENLIGNEHNVAMFELIDLVFPPSSKSNGPLQLAWGYVRPRLLLSRKGDTQKAHVHLYKCPQGNTKVCYKCFSHGVHDHMYIFLGYLFARCYKFWFN